MFFRKRLVAMISMVNPGWRFKELSMNSTGEQGIPSNASWLSKSLGVQIKAGGVDWPLGIIARAIWDAWLRIWRVSRSNILFVVRSKTSLITIANARMIKSWLRPLGELNSPLEIRKTGSGDELGITLLEIQRPLWLWSKVGVGRFFNPSEFWRKSMRELLPVLLAPMMESTGLGASSWPKCWRAWLLIIRMSLLITTKGTSAIVMTGTWKLILRLLADSWSGFKMSAYYIRFCPWSVQFHWPIK